MTIPDFATIMRPLLEHLADGRERGTDDTLEALAMHFQLTEDERSQLLPSGKQELFRNRVAWAKFYLKKAGALQNPRRGTYRITGRGLELVRDRSSQIDVSTLQRFPEFQEFLRSSRNAEERSDDGTARSVSPQEPLGPRSIVATELTPEELLEKGYSQMNGQLAAELLERVKQASPLFFETLVIDVLLALGYGGSRRDAGRTVGRSGDGGIDGIINEDRLGLDTIYVQAKRWEGVVGRPELQKFAGALQGQRARKGVFITTSTFTREAIDFVKSIDSRIVLIAGDQLAQLMIDHSVGVAEVASYSVKRIDSDYFGET